MIIPGIMAARVFSSIYIPGDAPPGTVVFDDPQSYFEILPNIAGYDYGYDVEQGIWYATRTSPTTQAQGHAVNFRFEPWALRPSYLVVEIEFIGADGSQPASNSVRPDARLGGVNRQPNSPGRKVFVFPNEATESGRSFNMFKFYETEIGDGFIIHFAGYIP